MEQTMYNIQLTVKHVRGESNPVADALSRVHMAKSRDCRLELLAKGCVEESVDKSMCYT